MIVHQVFAQIYDNEIKNIIVCDNYEIANRLARSVYGDKAISVECTLYAVRIGDKFVDGAFYSAEDTELENPIAKQNTAEEDCQILKIENEILQDSVEDAQANIDYLAIMMEVEL